MAELSLSQLIDTCPGRLHHLFSGYLGNIPSLELKSSMQYTLETGGKYLRPLLIYATGHTFKASLDNLDIPASAVELIHTYSLIHDDLPCMDNADLRRGKPTCHKVYGEAIAVLTGDALHTLAMQIIAGHPAPLKPERRVRMMHALTKACGAFGMAAGQAIDINLGNDTSIPSHLLESMYKLKTGALFSACVELGHLASPDDDDIHRIALREFSERIGLAFQIQDDILDLEAPTETLGKPQGIDVTNNKMTYPALLGMAAAKERVQTLYLQALESIDYLGSRAQLLRELIRYMLARKN
jgi:farnesyl diphosphate synthase